MKFYQEEKKITGDCIKIKNRKKLIERSVIWQTIKIVKYFKFIVLIFLLIVSFSVRAQDRASWLREAKFGVMTHYLQDWLSRTENKKIDIIEWNKLVDNINVNELAEEVKSVGAKYMFFTIGQNSGYYVSPNATYDKIVAHDTSRCSRRDLIADIGVALHKLGFDGCYWPNIMYRNETEPNFKSFAKAARSGNPNSIIAFNPGVFYRLQSPGPYEDYLAGEINKADSISIKRDYDGKIDGKQIHVLCFLGERWGMGSPRFSNEQIISYTELLLNSGGAITWDVPIQSNGHIYQPFIDQLKIIGKTVVDFEKQKGK